jgi:hypothetical protein
MSSSYAGVLPWWHLPLAGCALVFGQTMGICAVLWPRSETPGIEFMQDIVIPAAFAVFACAGAIGGAMLLSTR